jgi:D-xylose transport system substrate-binding protein
LTNGNVEVQGGKTIPSVLATPIIVDQKNVADTVIKDGFLTKEEVCKGLSTKAAGVCP